MRVQNKWPDSAFLQPLKNRPHLEPDPSFVHSLTNRVNQSSKEKKSKPIVVLVSFLVLFLFGICFYNLYLTQFNKEMASIPHENRNSKKVFLYNIDRLISENPNYNKMYHRIITKAWGETTSGEAFISYLEALKNGDEKKINQYAFDSNQTANLIRFYQNINYNSLNITKIVLSKAEPALQITLHYTVKPGKEVKSRTLELMFQDTGISIYDPESSSELY